MTIDHLSFSSLNTYNGCPRRFYLGKVKKAEELPAWYFAGGSAVHSYIQHTILGSSEASFESYFLAEVERYQLIEPDTSLWLHAGPQEAPLVEELALKHYEACTLTALEILLDIKDVWHVEPDITGHLPGCSLPIKAFPDLLGEHKKWGPVILDWKTGSKPKNAIQLETYKALMNVQSNNIYLPDLKTGAWAMLKPGLYKNPLRKVELVETPESMGARFHEVELKIAKKIWPAMPEFACKFCEQRPNCKLQSGLTARTRFYDTPEKDGGFPF